MDLSRRTFLSFSALAVVLATPPYAKAWIHGSRPPGMLIGFPSAEGSIFKNWALNATTGGGQTAGTPYPALINNDGYPIDGASFTANYFMQVQIPFDVTSSDTVVLKLTNTGGAAGGDIGWQRGAPGFAGVSASSGSVVGGTAFNLVMTGTNPRATFTLPGSPGGTTISFAFKASGTFLGCSKLVICKLSDEASIDAATKPEDLIYQAYADQYTALKFATFRPMGTANTNFNNNTRTVDRVAWNTCLSYNITRWRPIAWAGTVSGTDTYASGARADGAPLADGLVVQAQFTNANTVTNPTYNYNSTGAAPIINGLYSPSRALSAGFITAAALGTLVYDAYQNVWLYFIGGLTPSPPVEIRLALAKKCGANYWHNTPIMYDTASIVLEITYCRDNRTAGQTVYQEWGNENWNASFQQWHWCTDRGAALNFPADNNRQIFGYVGLRIAQTAPTLNALFPTGGLKCVSAFQAVVFSATQTYQLNGADLSTGLGYSGYNSLIGVSYNSAPNRPVDGVSVLSYASYVNGAQCLQFDANYVSEHAAGRNFNKLTTAADQYALGDPANIAAALNFVDGDLRAGTNSAGTLGTANLLAFFQAGGNYPSFNAFATSYTPAKEVFQYEGSSASILAPSTATCTTIGISTSYGGAGGLIDNLFTAYKNDARFLSETVDWAQQFQMFSQSRGAAELQMVGPNAWAILTAGYGTTPWKSYSAVKALNGAP